MLNAIIKNLKDFFDITIFFTILFVGLFTLLSDYPYFKKVNYKKDAAVTFFIGIAFIVIPFVLWIVSVF